MVRYLVKTTSIATASNASFAGEISYHYHGKGGEMIASVGEHAKRTYTYKPLNKWLIEDYGYSRECDAKRSYDYRNPQNDKNWTSKTEIVKVVI